METFLFVLLVFIHLAHAEKEEAIDCVRSPSKYDFYGKEYDSASDLTKVSDLPMAIGLLKDHVVTSIQVCERIKNTSDDDVPRILGIQVTYGVYDEIDATLRDTRKMYPHGLNLDP